MLELLLVLLIIAALFGGFALSKFIWIVAVILVFFLILRLLDGGTY